MAILRYILESVTLALAPLGIGTIFDCKKHSSHYGTLPMKQPNSTMLSPYSQLTWHPRCPPSSEVHPATILTQL